MQWLDEDGSGSVEIDELQVCCGVRAMWCAASLNIPQEFWDGVPERKNMQLSLNAQRCGKVEDCCFGLFIFNHLAIISPVKAGIHVQL